MKARFLAFLLVILMVSLSSCGVQWQGGVWFIPVLIFGGALAAGGYAYYQTKQAGLSITKSHFLKFAIALVVIGIAVILYQNTQA